MAKQKKQFDEEILKMEENAEATAMKAEKTRKTSKEENKSSSNSSNPEESITIALAKEQIKALQDELQEEKKATSSAQSDLDKARKRLREADNTLDEARQHLARTIEDQKVGQEL